MKATSPRWHEVTESPHEHERRALAHVRELLPDRDPWAAWSNFTFVAKDGRHREVDLLVATPTGLHLIEIKNWHGHLTNEGQHWSRGGRPEKSPLDLTVQKGKELADYLQLEARRVDVRMQVPFVEAAIFLAEPSMRSSLDSYQRHHVYAPDDAMNDLPRVGRDLLFADARRRTPDPRFLDALPQLLRKIGISASAPSRMVGPWRLDPRPYDEGPTWQDFHATRTDVAGNPHRRVRVYLESHLEDDEARRSVRGAAQREFEAAEGVHHPGILAPADLDEHELGPALIIEQAGDADRLDHWLIRHQDTLTTAQRVGLVRQLASAVAYAHRKRLVHRALAPRAVIVEPGGTLRVGDWQVAARGLSSSRSRHQVAPTSLSANHLDPTVDPYLAPEFATEGADGTVDLDVFGVGSLAYLILTGAAPAATRRELNERLAREDGLDPRTGNDLLDTMVQEATRPEVGERTPSVDDLVDVLQAWSRPPRAPEKDPLEAATGDVLAGGYRVERVLGDGSSARAFLVRRDGLESVLKIGRTYDAAGLLAAEAAALEDLRHDHIAMLRRASFPVGPRHAIELTHAGPRTLADVLAADGPLRGEELRGLGDQLLSAAEYLAGRGRRHRDVKPANVGVQTDETGRQKATLFDFSLGVTPDDDLESGTHGYLDPLLGTTGRESYDDAAERYALAATLCELASGELPRWGDGTTAAAFVDAVTLTEDRFDPDLRGALTGFFRQSLAKAAGARFGSTEQMRAAWSAVFAAPPATVHPPAVGSLNVDVAVVSHLRSLASEVQRRTVDALEAACRPAPVLVPPVGARDQRMRLLTVTDELSGVVLVPDGVARGLLLRLMAPEAATSWARTHTASVNEVSGALELRDAVALDRLTEELTPELEDDLFAQVTDAELAELGIDPRMTAYARSGPSLGQLEAAQPFLPAEQYGVLLALARGQTVDQVRTTLVAPRRADGPVDPGDIGTAVGRTGGRIAMLEDLAQLRELLDRPISQFRTFLHPSQERLAYKANWGSVQVTGGPGTGKTVVALHRVKHLVERREALPGKVLLTTYTKGLASVLERDLRQMLDADRATSVQVVNIDSWANGLVRERLGKKWLPLVEDAEDRWQRAAAGAGTAKSPAFLDAEWVHVVQAQGITDEETYLACDRRGRGRPLPPAQRGPVWQAIQAFEKSLRADGRWTHAMIADEAARLLAADEPPFEHVVVDEIQDLHPAHWRLLRAAVKVKPEDLFLTGDPHQRIYGHRVSLRSVDINVGGRRSSKLTLSYRTSAEILAWSLRMLGNHHEVGLDDTADDLASYRSSFSGAAPDVVGAQTRDEELAGLVEAVRQWRAEGIDWEDIAVVGRSRWIYGSAAGALRKADIPVVELRKAGAESAVRLGTMHGLKGLEFRAVAVVGVREGVIPRQGLTPASEDEVVHRNEMQDERNLLFVAATRPRERLRVSWHGTPSPFLPVVTPSDAPSR